MSEEIQLNSNQIHLLKLIYKLRFVTNHLLSQYLYQARSTINEFKKTLSNKDVIELNDNQALVTNGDNRYVVEGEQPDL